MGYMFGFLMIEGNTGAIEQALEALGQVLHAIQS
jgi:hypothetical protein